MNEGEADPRALRLLIAATPDAETVLPWLRTLAVLAGFLTVAILLVTFELLGRV
ncbi:hypothetical protein [Halorubrum cibi]|uniref:Uncharacterized protein n=1 Tax=Halorubrum cibi TaxID=413815 RepID=A0A521CLW8_9EURY|nr:hypothetical protein [Halorubrum cibi]SMO59751.1 hypothetical protein SAMN06264867_104256 [Halorubrum cibi]